MNLFTVDHSSTSVILDGVLDIDILTKDTAGLIIDTWTDNEATVTQYLQTAGNIEDIAALGTYAAPSTNKCRFKQFNGYNYQLQLANGRFAVAGAKILTVRFSGAGIRSGGIFWTIDLARHAVNVTGWNGTTPNNLQSGRLDSHVGEIAAGVITTLTTAVEAAMLNESDGQALLAAMQLRVQQLFDAGADVPVATLVALIEAAIAARIITDHGSGSYIRNTEPDNASAAAAAASAASADGKLTAPRLAKIDNLLASGTYTVTTDLTALGTLAKQNLILAAIAQIDPAAEPLNGQQDTTATDTLGIFIGDDYTDDSPRGALSWAVQPAVDLTDAEGQFLVWIDGQEDNLIELDLEFENVGDEDQLCKVALTAAEMLEAGLRVAGTYQFEASITLASGELWTPAQGAFSPRRKRRGE